MSDEAKKTDWSKIDDVASPKSGTEANTALSQPIVPDAPMVADSQDVQGVVANYKLGKIKKRAAFEAIERIQKAKLEVLDHQLSEAVQTKKAEATMLAREFLAGLDADYQLVLQGIGIKNEAARQDTLKLLGDKTAETLKEVSEADWPEFMRIETVKVISARYIKFLDEIKDDLNPAD